MVFDIGAMLLKPVQRILKYPLLLNELAKVSYVFNNVLIHEIVKLKQYLEIKSVSKQCRFSDIFIDAYLSDSLHTKATEDDHSDKLELLAAITVMTDVAQAINEYKRRKDLGT